MGARGVPDEMSSWSTSNIMDWGFVDRCRARHQQHGLVARKLAAARHCALIHVPASRPMSQCLVHGVVGVDSCRSLEHPGNSITRRGISLQDARRHSAYSHAVAREDLAASVTAYVSQPETAAKEAAGLHQFSCRRTAVQESDVLVEEAYGMERALFDPVQRDYMGRTSLDHREMSPRGQYFGVRALEGGTEDSIPEMREARSGKPGLPPVEPRFHHRRDSHGAGTCHCCLQVGNSRIGAREPGPCRIR